MWPSLPASEADGSSLRERSSTTGSSTSDEPTALPLAVSVRLGSASSTLGATALRLATTDVEAVNPNQPDAEGSSQRQRAFTLETVVPIQRFGGAAAALAKTTEGVGATRAAATRATRQAKCAALRIGAASSATAHANLLESLTTLRQGMTGHARDMLGVEPTAVRKKKLANAKEQRTR